VQPTSPPVLWVGRAPTSIKNKGQVHYIEVVSDKEEAGYETDGPEQQQAAEEQSAEYEPEQLL